MNEVSVEKNNNVAKIFLSGRIDSNNAQSAEKEINENIEGANISSLVIDTENLEYISSAGLRVLLHLKKEYDDLKIVNVNPDIYEILDMTGFTQMMTVEKAYRKISVEGCEVIGEGANGKVYRIDRDNVVKTYKNADALSEIQHEREVARTALVLGVPTAISYDVVKVGDSYGSVFELLNAKSFAEIIAKEPERMDWCVDEYTKMLKKIHSTKVPEGKLPKMKDNALKWLGNLKGVLPDATYEKLQKLLDELPDSDYMIHGDYHTKNIVQTDDEVLLIDMDTLAVGHPIFELAQMYNSFLGFSEFNHDDIKKFQGFDRETGEEFFIKSLKKYSGYEDAEKVNELLDKARIAGYIRLIDWHMRHKDLNDADVKNAVELWKNKLIELTDKIDSLDFDTDESAGEESDKNEIELEAIEENLPKVMEYVDSKLESSKCSAKEKMSIDIAVEEIFVNIANYAYSPETGDVTVRVEVSKEPVVVTITFVDGGVPYDPLAKEDPDVTLSADEREPGGLGIFMTKKSMDDVIYEYKDGKNILTLKKELK